MSIDREWSFAHARDRRPFANGTEGEVWRYNWCENCLREAPYRNGISQTGCVLLDIAYLGKTPAQWLDGPRNEEGLYSMQDQYHCIEFRGADGGDGGEPRPKPDPRGQGTLFDRDDYTGTRMYVDVQPQAVNA